MVETNVKRVQHVDGGYVAEILVKEGDPLEQRTSSSGSTARC
ncbi:hypothetical protein USDA257_c28970 [Sinorhizobium fredii USDA 257]|uniref:Uncharacterized protein n=1 Tax=Sinorhizobium fredii (strain USDA 257) TaxID=1185652 RepID=I3X6G2_SINF2|nr:hypothetical protein USDA257_c28970 [Sinorhizobium fredii USDA 257]